MVEVIIVDDLKFGSVFGYIYLFTTLLDATGNPILRQDAHQKLVQYDFKLTTFDQKSGSNAYFDVYKFNCTFPKDIHECFDKDMNPEDSFVKTKHYARHFSSNWYDFLLFFRERKVFESLK